MVPELQNHNKSHAAHNTETLQDSCWKPANRKRGWFQTRTRHNWTGRILCRILIEKRLQHQEDMLLLHRFTKGFWQSLVQVKHGDPGRYHVKDCPSRSLEDGGRLGGEKTNWLTNKCPVQDLMTLAPEQRELQSLGEGWANGRAGTTCPLSLSLDNHDIMFDLFPYMGIFLITFFNLVNLVPSAKVSPVT